jgi:hypothetical protein
VELYIHIDAFVYKSRWALQQARSTPADIFIAKSEKFYGKYVHIIIPSAGIENLIELESTTCTLVSCCALVPSTTK